MPGWSPSRRRFRRCGAGLWAISLTILLMALFPRLGHTAGASADFQIPGLNRRYPDLAASGQPIRKGPLVIRPSFSRQELVLVRHRLRLRARADGSHDAELWVEFEGSGQLVVDVSAAGLEHQFQDDVVFPLQTQTLRGRVKIARVRGGYRVTALELPRETRVRLQSHLGGELVGWCETLAALPLSPVESCAGLDRALSSAAVPLPPAGERYFLGAGDLAPADRRRLDAYLAAAGSAPPAQNRR